MVIVADSIASLKHKHCDYWQICILYGWTKKDRQKKLTNDQIVLTADWNNMNKYMNDNTSKLQWQLTVSDTMQPASILPCSSGSSMMLQLMLIFPIMPILSLPLCRKQDRYALLVQFWLYWEIAHHKLLATQCPYKLCRCNLESSHSPTATQQRTVIFWRSNLSNTSFEPPTQINPAK